MSKTAIWILNNIDELLGLFLIILYNRSISKIEINFTRDVILPETKPKVISSYPRGINFDF